MIMMKNVCIDTEILDVLTGSELKLFMIVKSYDEGLGSYVSPNKISQDHNIPLRTVYNQIESLKRKGVLRFEYETVNGSKVKVWKWDFANYGKNAENADKQSTSTSKEKTFAKNGTVCSSSFKYKKTTTTYVAKNGKNKISDPVNADKIMEKEAFAKNGKTLESLFEDINRLINISKRVFEKAAGEYPVSEIKKAAVYTYQKNPQKPESYFMMTLKNEWAFDIFDGDFEKEVERVKSERERKMRMESDKAKKAELKRIEEETRKRQMKLEKARIRALEEKLMKGEIPLNFDVMNEFSRSRVSAALRKKDYKIAALYLLPYMQNEMENDGVAV